MVCELTTTSLGRNVVSLGLDATGFKLGPVAKVANVTGLGKKLTVSAPNSSLTSSPKKVAAVEPWFVGLAVEEGRKVGFE